MKITGINCVIWSVSEIDSEATGGMKAAILDVVYCGNPNFDHRMLNGKCFISP